MKTIIIRDIIVGLLAGYVPINAMGSQMGKECEKNGFSFVSAARFTPLMFAVLFPVVMAILRYYGISKNYWILGLVFAVIVSSIGRFIMDIPRKVFEMKNPNWFHVYAIVAWELFFNTIARLVYEY